MGVEIDFLGASGTVTGSKYLVCGGGKKVLVDCGLFQGSREWREHNWEPFPIDLGEIDAVVITHAHIDHTGLLPRYFELGLRCPIFASSATVDLAGVLLPDSARLQEEEAEFRSEKGRSRHELPKPLYTEEQANGVLKLFRTVPVGQDKEIIPGVALRLERMGHILGACSVSLELGGKRLLFSGDIGRYTVPILKDPVPRELHDLLVIESTYGDRLHEDSDVLPKLEEIINETFTRSGAVVIPSFAVGRAQLLLYYLRELKEQKRIPDIPVIIDSPMAQSATEIYRKHPKDYDDEALGIASGGRSPFDLSKLYFTRNRNESKKLNSIDEPMIIISASGMLSGGRILHHLFHRVSSPQNCILFVGFQPPGGRGDWMLKGSKTMRLFHQEVDVRARVESISGLSAHGDRDELLKWCRSCEGTPERVMVTHGEPDSAKAFAGSLKKELNWNAKPATYRERLTLE